MEFSEYQKLAQKTNLAKSITNKLSIPHWLYLALGLAGESGEVVDKLKKLLRDRDGHIDNEFRDRLLKELGDVLWYLSQLALEFDIDLDEVARENINKLQSRLKRGKIHGEGDNR